MTEARSPTWRSLLADATARVGAADARRIVEEASGWHGAGHVLHLDDASTPLTHATWQRLVERRATGEPLQYVLGSWSFRQLDLYVDRRVLIPRPETEVVAGQAVDAVHRLGARTALDLGTGSGAIALSLAVECPGVHVWATDVSHDALEVARANLAGVGHAATRVRLAQGDWFDALPSDLRGVADVVAANPPYVADTDALPSEVEAWEPTIALRAGPTGLEAIARIAQQAPAWLRPGGVLVLEIGETQGQAARELASAAGFTEVAVLPDLVGRDRVLIASA
jgi:release factor glutamine methyltransferase